MPSCLAHPASTAPPPPPPAAAACRAARLEALGIQASRRRASWRQRVTSLDRLVDVLGFPTTYALLSLAPASSAPGMAAEAVHSAVNCSGSGSGGNAGVSSSSGWGTSSGVGELSSMQQAAGQSAAKAGLTASEAEDVVRWHRGLQAGALPTGLGQALAARGLGPTR